MTQLLNPYLHGYSLLIREPRSERIVPVEIWHYASDRLVHVAASELEAVRWCRLNRAIPKSAPAERHWHELDHS